MKEDKRTWRDNYIVSFGFGFVTGGFTILVFMMILKYGIAALKTAIGV